MLRALMLHIRRGWDQLATATGLRRLPPVPTVAIVLIVGVIWPLSGEMLSRKADLASTLAVERLGRFASDLKDRKQGPEVGPTGEILSRRPACYWPRHKDAAHYVLRLSRDDGTAWIDRAVVEDPYFVMTAAGALDPARGYRFEVEAFDKDGHVLAKHHGEFKVALPGKDLLDLLKRAHEELDEYETSLVLSGFFAEHGSEHDVVSGLLAAHDANPRKFAADVSEGKFADQYGAWLAGAVGARTGSPDS